MVLRQYDLSYSYPDFCITAERSNTFPSYHDNTLSLLEIFKAMAMKFIAKIICIVSLFVFFGDAYGQEEQVAFLPGVFELTEDQRVNADVLNDYADGFYNALLFKTTNDYILRIQYQKRGKQWTEDVPISESNLRELREKLENSLKETPEQRAKDQTSSGRGYLITSTSLHAIAQSRIFSNVFNRTVTVTDPFGSYSYTERTKLGIAFPYLATAGAITSSVLLTRDKHILPSAANMHFWGSLFGYGHGLLLTSMIQEPYNYTNDDVILESVLISGTSILEGWLGYQIAKKHNFSYTRSKAINSGNFWGGISGLLAFGMFADEFESNHGGIGFSGLIGSGLGLFTANRLVQKYPRSSGDITAINMAGLVGFSWGSALAVSFDWYERGLFTSTFITTLGGLALSGLSTRNTNFTNLEGGLIAVGSIAGGALGLGVSNLVDAEETGYFISAALGLTAGWFITYQLLARNDTPLKSLGFGNKIRWNINPASIGLAMSSPEKQANLMRQNIRMDLVNLSYSF